MRDDKILASLLKQMFEDLGIDSGAPSIGSMRLLPLYNLQAKNLRKMGHNKYAVHLLEKVVKIRESTLSEDHPVWKNR